MPGAAADRRGALPRRATRELVGHDMVVAYLGSDDSGAINVPVGAEGKGLTGWDMDQSDRDFGVVVGTGSTLAFTSATGSRAETTTSFEFTTGSEDITNIFAISVAPGATVAIV